MDCPLNLEIKLVINKHFLSSVDSIVNQAVFSVITHVCTVLLPLSACTCTVMDYGKYYLVHKTNMQVLDQHLLLSRSLIHKKNFNMNLRCHKCMHTYMHVHTYTY